MSSVKILIGFILISVFITSGPALAGAVDASAPTDTDGKPGSVISGETVDSSNGTNDRNDTTVDVVITFVNDSARQNPSFDVTMNVTGGEDIGIAPVLFATTNESALPAISEAPGVESVSIDHRVQLRRNSSISGGQTQLAGSGETSQTVPWGVQRIGAPKISDRIRKKGTQNVTVAVVDSGIDSSHPDLGDSVIWGANFTYGSERYGVQTADDNNGHGTAVAGIIAARDNDRGVVGVAPGTKLYAIKALRSNNAGTISSLITGIDAAVAGPDGVVGTNDDADIVHMSVGTTVDDDELATVVAAASEHAILVGSAGNLGDNNPETTEVTYPTAYPKVLAVTATDQNNETTLYSSEGPEVDIAAPGSSVTTLASDGGTVEFSGTSAAAPHVSGSVAMMLAADRVTPMEHRTNSEIRERLMSASQDIEEPGPDRFSGNGLLRVDKAMIGLLEETGTRIVGDRTLSSGEVTSVSVVIYAAGDYVTVSESFPHSFTDAEVGPVRVNGDLTTTISKSSNKNKSIVRINGLKTGAKVNITHIVQAPVASSSVNRNYTIIGEATNGGKKIKIDPVELTVQPSSTGELIAIYDTDDDGNIDVSELSQAAADYSNGDISITELGNVVAKYTGAALSSSG